MTRLRDLEKRLAQLEAAVGTGGGGSFTIGATVDRIDDFNGLGVMVPADPSVATLVTATIRLKSEATGAPTSGDLETYSDLEGNEPLGLYSVPSFHVEGSGPTEAWIDVPLTAIVPAGGSYYLNADVPPDGPLTFRPLVYLVEQPLG